MQDKGEAFCKYFVPHHLQTKVSRVEHQPPALMQRLKNFIQLWWDVESNLAPSLFHFKRIFQLSCCKEAGHHHGRHNIKNNTVYHSAFFPFSLVSPENTQQFLFYKKHLTWCLSVNSVSFISSFSYKKKSIRCLQVNAFDLITINYFKK